MPKRPWNIVYAIGLALWATVALAEQTPPQQPKPAEATSQANKQAEQQPPAVLQPPPAPPAPKEHNPSTAQESPKEPKGNLLWGDSLAQWIMAATGVLALLVSGWAVWLVYKTLGANQDAVAQAKRSADAAINATQIARDALGAERAWISFLEWNTIEVEDSTINGQFVRKGIGFFVSFINSGRSPAVRAVGYSSHKFIDVDEAIPLFDAGNMRDDSNPAAVGPQIKFNTPPRFLNDIETSDFKNRRRRLIIYTKVSYSDIFTPSIERITEMTAESIYHGEKRDSKGKMTPNITYTAAGTQNRVT